MFPGPYYTYQDIAAVPSKECGWEQARENRLPRSPSAPSSFHNKAILAAAHCSLLSIDYFFSSWESSRLRKKRQFRGATGAVVSSRLAVPPTTTHQTLMSDTSKPCCFRPISMFPRFTNNSDIDLKDTFRFSKTSGADEIIIFREVPLELFPRRVDT